MNKQQLVEQVAARLGDRKAAATAVEAVLDTVTGALAEGERVAIFGFGVFERVDRAARTARNPATGGTVEVPATAVPRFRPGQGLKDAVNGRTARPARGAAAPRATGADDPTPTTTTRAKPAKPAKDDAGPGKKAEGKKADGKGAAGKAKGKGKGKKAKGKKD